MVDLPEDVEEQPESTTISSIKGPVKITIDWDIPKFSTLKNHTGSMTSKSTVIGSSAWTLQLHPLADADVSDHDRIGSIDVMHECLTMDLTEFSGYFKISVMDAKNKRHLQTESTSTFRPPIEVVGSNLAFKHIDIWGAKPTLFLKDDTLKLIAEISYDSVKQMHHNLFEPLEEKLQIMYDAAEDDVTLVSSDGKETAVNRSILKASSPVFASTLKSNMVESETGRCVMTDVSGGTMHRMVQYMHFHNRTGLDESARDVLVAADKYQMDELKNLCENIVVTQLTDDTATELLILADKVTALTLKSAALRHLAVNLRTMATSDYLKQLTDNGDIKLLGEVLGAVAQHGTETSQTTANSVDSAKKTAEKPRKRKTADQ